MMPVFVWTVSNSSYIIVSWRQVYNYKGCGEVWWLGLTPLNFDWPILGGGVGILGAQWGAGSLLVITAPP